jgi:hypothetical protein
MDVVGHEDPRMYRTRSTEDIFCEPFEEAGLILIIPEDRRFVYPPDDDVMQCSGCIKAGFSWHEEILFKRKMFVKGKA